MQPGCNDATCRSYATGSYNCIWSTSIDCAAIKRTSPPAARMTDQVLAVCGLPLREDRHIRLQHLRSRFRNAVETAASIAGREHQRISAQNVRNRLRGAGIRARRPYTGNPLTPRRRQGRFGWLRRHDPRIRRRQ